MTPYDYKWLHINDYISTELLSTNLDVSFIQELLTWNKPVTQKSIKNCAYEFQD